jgi:predicted PurR-regulated permease PerM
MLVFASFIVIVAGLNLASPILIPFLLAIFIAIICTPTQRILIKKGLPPSLAVFIVLSLLLISASLLAVFVGASMNDFLSQLPNYQQQLEDQFSGLAINLQNAGFLIPNTDIRELMKPDIAMTIAANTFKKLSAVLTNFFLISLTVVFILLEASGFKHKIRLAFNDSEKSLENFDTFITSVNRYLAIKTIFSFFTGVIIAIGLSIIGVNHPLLWGLVAFLLNFIPNIGSIIAAIPAVLLALIQLGPISAGLCASLFLAVNMIVGSFLEPKFMGKDLGLSTLVVFISLVFWGSILGPVGMLLSIPLTMIIKIALEVNEETRWIAILLGSGGSAKKELSLNN